LYFLTMVYLSIYQYTKFNKRRILLHFIFFLFCFVFFGGTGVWTQGFALTQQTFNSLTHTSSPLSSGDGGLANYLTRLSSNPDPPDLSLWRS
jgi:hypothetical protein